MGVEVKSATIKQEDGYAVIRIPVEEVHGLKVALNPCSCRATKSTKTQSIRERLQRALGKIEIPK